MNIKKCMLFACLPLLAISSLVGCKKGPQVSGSNVVQIVIYKGSYGIEWVKKLGEEFSKTFPGKSIKIEEASSLVGEKQRQDLMTPSKNQIDLYLFGNANMAEIIASSKGVLKTSNYSRLFKVVQTVHELSQEVGVQRTICTAKVQIRYKSRQISFEMHRNLTVKH